MTEVPTDLMTFCILWQMKIPMEAISSYFGRMQCVPTFNFTNLINLMN